jgi:hypothetical protein
MARRARLCVKLHHPADPAKSGERDAEILLEDVGLGGVCGT